MFTGIVTGVGVVEGVERAEGLVRLEISAPEGLLAGAVPGASIAVDGACLTPVTLTPPRFTVELVASTLTRTVAKGYHPGSAVNLERAMVLGERLDGHLVQGHVDGVGEVTALREEGGTRFLEVRIPPEVHRQTLLHGSITLNGVSLTVNHLLDGDRIEVAIIPHTWEHTNFRALAPGASLNVEGDLIGKYVAKLLNLSAPADRLPGANS